jgi:hypothetical protein
MYNKRSYHFKAMSLRQHLDGQERKLYKINMRAKLYSSFTYSNYLSLFDSRQTLKRKYLVHKFDIIMCSDYSQTPNSSLKLAITQLCQLSPVDLSHI